MADSYLFYDLETSGLDPRDSRIMQFAGQRTDMDLNPLGEPFNYLVKLTPDILPSPQAILVTGITPQMTLTDGITEAEFLNIFHQQISLPGTTFVGYNNVRFDDEFMRFSNYRNFYDPYEWHYKDGRRRWDLLDVIRITRALRPEGIMWPLTAKKTPANKLTDITSANEIAHKDAHDALADVTALIDVAKLIRTNQPRLFSYLSDSMPNKNRITELLESKQPLIYTSGGYFAHSLSTTAIIFIGDLKDGGSLVYDLRQDPQKYTKMSEHELRSLMDYDTNTLTNPFLVVKANKCPAIAPLSVLDEASEKNIDLNKATINKHLNEFKSINQTFFQKIKNIYDEVYSSKDYSSDVVDAQLYDGFFDRSDSAKFAEVRDLIPSELSTDEHIFKDERLNKLIFLYKARNYTRSLTSEETVKFEQFRQQYLFDGGSNSRMSKFLQELTVLAQQPKITANQLYILEELKLYAESVAPIDL
jgi:exodeoxyribonuclease-1